jgi:hypothetical protein
MIQYIRTKNIYNKMSYSMGISQIANLMIGFGDGSSSGFSKMLLILFSTLATFIGQYIFENSHRIMRDIGHIRNYSRLLFSKKMQFLMVITETDSVCYVKASDTVKALVHYIDKYVDGLGNITNMREMFVSSYNCYNYGTT